MTTLRIAVLDDYQQVALESADWTQLPPGSEVQVFRDHLSDEASEPLPQDHPLRRLPNTVITPHLGYVTRETYAIFYRDAVENIRAFADGKALRVIEP